MAGLNVKRAAKEFSQLHASIGKPDAAHLVSVSLPDEDNVLQWAVVFHGPADTPYAGGFFRATVTIGPEYPHRDPTIRFVTPVWHPGVMDDGKLCEALFSDWAPTMGVKDALLRVHKMLAAPAEFAMINDTIAKQFSEDRKAFDKKAAEITKVHAKASK
uniref:UBC core domain-containing protein n=1 Tax=Neobodo designis TaxID=312471 RepID=A0A7S1KWI8_NEODS|mmetsp:Transcript_10279/g.31780  ORF Transcript_10279/g.31780 Transcript_10279/m.31780 type:complete len:159 (+) Transcript_10279:83-559(+)|eukprot:CAMPEP_0174850826 /NCGR_PEP_ID=MMETSP1114-20130205/21162_1 /TAXON_ID=312471 /ORGANISM="Neobodo designis, Strain CCAP 1951/1" /LENGTH=158 /DNA_ID=CAMNT_0016085313 /DNA_START=83 /DNA_END=559 /DNA_ORIENTATION=-